MRKNHELKRKRNVRNQYKIIYIFTEGKETEVIYFTRKKEEVVKEIRRNNIKIQIKGKGRGTRSLVEYALNFLRKENVDLNLDDCWVVFDKDDYKKDFNDAISMAEANNLKVAYSNEAFELWLLLHFCFLTSAIGREDYIKKLNENLKHLTNDRKIKYSKDLDIYPLIKKNEETAIKNAKKLLKEYKYERSYLKKNPSTTVYLLVEELNNWKTKKD